VNVLKVNWPKGECFTLFIGVKYIWHEQRKFAIRGHTFSKEFSTSTEQKKRGSFAKEPFQKWALLQKETCEVWVPNHHLLIHSKQRYCVFFVYFFPSCIFLRVFFHIYTECGHTLWKECSTFTELLRLTYVHTCTHIHLTRARPRIHTHMVTPARMRAGVKCRFHTTRTHGHCATFDTRTHIVPHAHTRTGYNCTFDTSRAKNFFCIYIYIYIYI